jgi:hypothetical protein
MTRCEEIHQFPFGFVTPLKSDHAGCRHN